jgi:hypothetical protein
MHANKEILYILKTVKFLIFGALFRRRLSLSLPPPPPRPSRRVAIGLRLDGGSCRCRRGVAWAAAAARPSRRTAASAVREKLGGYWTRAPRPSRSSASTARCPIPPLSSRPPYALG